MFKFLVLVLLLFISQTTEAKKKKEPTSLESATNTISKYINSVTEFLQDIMETFSDFMGSTGKKNKKKKSMWSISNMWKYASNNLKHGYKIIDDTVSILRMARSIIDDVSPILPDVTLAKFIETLLYNLVPELMKKNAPITENLIDVETTSISKM